MNTMNKMVAASLGGSGTVANGLVALKASVDSKYSAGASDSELAQWLSVSSSLSEADLPSINTMLQTKTFLCANGVLTVADAALCLAIATCNFQDAVKKCGAIMRYAVYIQSLLKKQNGVDAIEFYATATPIPIGTGIATSPAPAAVAAPVAAEKKKEKAAPAAADAKAAKPAKADKADAAPAAEVELEPYFWIFV